MEAACVGVKCVLQKLLQTNERICFVQHLLKGRARMLAHILDMDPPTGEVKCSQRASQTN